MYIYIFYTSLCFLNGLLNILKVPHAPLFFLTLKNLSVYANFY